ncbi:PD-(D/E)XK motif protein [Azospirillum brasilense]|uniref:PD-(D/E)XK motif protein n=1 Tax=Azospirillum brasilense TaxID=192 RepID=A0A6L3ASM3_AZOBR|nr:PD-(D/E)XK motif protein [Azospirillum brasilense]KAA0678180.1 PD-(D/E)XK motif protein [Azospirillum brasilense]
MTSADLAGLAWERLRKEPRSTAEDLSTPSLALPTRTAHGHARLSLGPDGEPRLLLPIGNGDAFPAVQDGRGLAFKDRVLLLSGRSVRFIDVICRELTLEAVFREVVTAILRRLDSGETPGHAVEAAIREFRELLLRAQSRSVTAETAVGLVGELRLLNRLLEIRPDAWSAWTGPLPGRHDFRAGDLAIEVKSSLRRQSRVVEISALDQLAEPSGGELFLFYGSFEESAAGPLSVPGEVSRALSLASDPGELTQRLALIGYDPALDELWAQFRFSFLDSDVYRVVSGFPRLTPASLAEAELPSGVSHFRYRVNLSAARDFRLDRPEAEALVQRFAACLL